jgi:hypothetical protein
LDKERELTFILALRPRKERGLEILARVLFSRPVHQQLFSVLRLALRPINFEACRPAAGVDDMALKAMRWDSFNPSWDKDLDKGRASEG